MAENVFFSHVDCVRDINIQVSSVHT